MKTNNTPVLANVPPDISEVQPLSAADRACLDQVREVLDRHGKTDRFGLTLVHGHFPIKPGEILTEACDKEKRTLTLSPQKRKGFRSGSFIDTSWRFVGKTLVPVTTCRNSGPQGYIH